MNIPYIMKALGTNKLDDLIEALELPSIDTNLLVWDAEKRGDIRVDFDANMVEALVEPEAFGDEDLLNKFTRVLQYYLAEGALLTRAVLERSAAGAASRAVIAATLQKALDDGLLWVYPVHVEETEGRNPAHVFEFLCLSDQDEASVKLAADKAVAEWLALFDDVGDSAS